MEPAGSAVRLRFSDGSSLVLPPEALPSIPLERGTRLEGETLRQLRAASRERLAVARALSLVSRSRHTARGLALKLERRGFEPDAVRRAVERVTELGYLDDEEAARSWLEHRLERRPAGRGALLAGLLRNGVPRETAERVVDEALPPEAEAEAARRLLERLFPTTRARRALEGEPARSAALRKLESRGFTRQAARLALRGLGDDEPGG